MEGKILVVMSSAKHLDLRDGKKYPTGFYLNEFAIPFRKLVEAGYTPVIANPNGDRPLMDANSNHAMFFGGDDVLVDDREDAQPATVVGAVADKVPTPDVVDALRLGRDSCQAVACSD